MFISANFVAYRSRLNGLETFGPPLPEKVVLIWPDGAESSG